MLHLARASGIDLLDTAIAYGDSESCLGHADTRDFKVVTKLPAVPEGCADIAAWVEAEVDSSLARLRRDDLYGLLLHRPRQLLEPVGEALVEALEGLKAAGKLQKFGVSLAAPSDIGELTTRMRLDLVQAPFNLVDRRLQTSGWLKRLHEDGVEIHARSVFLQGLLLMRRDRIPQKFSRWNALWDAWHDWLGHSDVSGVRACVGFALGVEEIDRVVIGAQSVAQLQQIIQATGTPGCTGLPQLACDAEELIDPSRWPTL
jgi:aryl-alcohol dehydrogenase-like predicted oxidoreductase